MADVAQLAEHQIVALEAVGSNPIIRPKKKPCTSMMQGFFRLNGSVRGSASLYPLETTLRRVI